MSVVLVPITQGTGPQLANSAVQRRVMRSEAALPEMTPVELAMAFDLTLPVVGKVDVAKPVGQAVNAAYRAGRFVIGHEVMPLWDGATEPAAWDSLHQTTWVRWRKGQPFDPLVIPVILGVLVAGFVVWQVMTHWSFSKAVEKAAGGALHEALQAVGGYGKAALIGAGILGGCARGRGDPEGLGRRQGWRVSRETGAGRSRSR